MKNIVYVVVLVVLASAGAFVAFERAKEQKNRELELLARRAEADQAKAASKQREAVKNAETAKADARAAEDRRVAAEAERAAKEVERDAKKAEAEAAAENARRAEAEAKTAAENARRAEAESKAAAARQAAEEAVAAVVIATNETRQAELRISENSRAMAELELQNKTAEIKSAEYKKLELDRALAEVDELREELRRREATTRPDRTIQDLMSESERRRAEEEAKKVAEEEKRLAELAAKDRAAFEAEMARRREINKRGVVAPEAKPLSAADKMVARAQDELSRTSSEGSAAIHKRIVASLEAEIRKAVAERRVEDAEFCLKNLMMLVPDYKPDPKLLSPE